MDTEDDDDAVKLSLAIHTTAIDTSYSSVLSLRRHCRVWLKVKKIYRPCEETFLSLKVNPSIFTLNLPLILSSQPIDFKIMSRTQTRSAIASIVSPSTPTRTVSQAFVGIKAPSQSRKRVKAEPTETTLNAEEKASPSKKIKSASIKTEAKEESFTFLSREEVIKCTTITYPKLPFHLSDAISHLRNIDVRFHPLLDEIKLTPYEEVKNGQVKELDLFRTLTSSVLGQQVSWLAARVILYRFIRLFFPDLPEKPDFTLTPRDSLPFPHPIDVAQSECTEERLRSAGLSGAKARYVKDIATRFADGRLDVRKIIEMQEEECIQELVVVKGIGKWTAEMLLIFALRRANILPVGDLGVQRGIVLFYLAGQEGPSISKRKKSKTPKGEVKSETTDTIHTDNEPVSVVESHLNESQVEVERTIANVPAMATGPEVKVEDEASSPAVMQPLPEGISLSLLRSRCDGKKAKGNVYLT